MHRYLEKKIQDDLKEKMVFVGGPRQVGKTTLAFHLLQTEDFEHPAYLNWDEPQTKRMLLNGELPAEQPFIIFDEIHKFKGWRNLIKGFYDRHRSKKSFLITGSARLDYYRRGGDSLQGRYYYYRLHPLSLKEINVHPSQNDFEQLFRFGGFPEPFLKADLINHQRWQKDRRSRVIYEDLSSLEMVKEVTQIELLVDVLPVRVGSVLSVANLRQDLSVAFETAERWIQILERLYYCFRIAPYGPPRIKAAKKEKKLYLWDWSLCENKGARFENMVASHLLKYCHFLEDTEGKRMELRFIRDPTGKEIDFVVLEKNTPLFGVECKTGEREISPSIKYFAQRTNIPQFYQVHTGKKDTEDLSCRTRILPFSTFFQGLV